MSMKEEDSFPFKVGEIVESKYHKEGYRGSWFKSEIVKISLRNKVEVWCSLRYPDFTEEKDTWTKAYQIFPSVDKDSKQKTKELMIRPAFPPVVQRCDFDQNLFVGSTVAVVDDEWKVGDLVDWWTDECFWECQITEILDKDTVKVELPKRPIGEGNGCPYVANTKDLRPSLSWCPKNGWRVPSKVKPYERSCVLLLNVQEESRFAMKSDQAVSYESGPSGRKLCEEVTSSPFRESTLEEEDTFNKWKSRDRKRKNLQKYSKVVTSPPVSVRGSCQSFSGESGKEGSEPLIEAQMDVIGVESKTLVQEDAKCINKKVNSNRKFLLSRKLIRNARQSFWAPRFSSSPFVTPAIKQKCDYGQVDKCHSQHDDSYLEDPCITPNVPFSVATPPLFSEWRNQSAGEKSSCDRAGQSVGSPGLDSAANNLKVGEFADAILETVEREQCGKEQHMWNKQSDEKVDEFHGASFQTELQNLKNPEVTPENPILPAALSTCVWEEYQGNKNSNNTLGFPQQDNNQHQACILALPAFSHLSALEMRRIQAQNRTRSLKNLTNESHGFIDSPSDRLHPGVDPPNLVKSKKRVVTHGSTTRGAVLSSNDFLEEINSQTSYQKASFLSSFPAVRRERTKHSRSIGVVSHGIVLGKEGTGEELIGMLLTLQEMSEKVIFMRECLQLGLKKLFETREKAVWRVTTNIQ